MRFSYCIFDTFRVPCGGVRFAASAGRQRPAPPTVDRTLYLMLFKDFNNALVLLKQL